MATPHVKSPFHSKRARHVLQPCRPLQGRLRNRLPITVKAVQYASFAAGCQASGQFECLIKAALPVSAMIEGHRHQAVPLTGSNVLVKRIGQPLHQTIPPVVFIAIFESDDGLANLARRTITGPRPFEMPFSLGAIVAKESGFTGQPPEKTRAALPAERRLHSDRFGLPAVRSRKGEIQRALSPLAGVGADAGSGKTEG